MKRFTCNIHSISYFNGDTRKVLLALPEGEAVTFCAGQYLEIILPNKKCPFSIANAPGLKGLIEIHVRPTPNSDDSRQIEKLLDDGGPLEIELPKGDCFLQAPPNNPLILIAASTGITQMKCLVEYLLEERFDQPIYLYWGVLKDSDLYLSPLCSEWVKSHPNFHYIPVVSEPALSPQWQGRTGLVGLVALEDFQDLRDVTVFVSGGPAMVYATLDAFVAKGMPEANMHSDIFSYAPRPKQVAR